MYQQITLQKNSSVDKFDSVKLTQEKYDARWIYTLCTTLRAGVRI